MTSSPSSLKNHQSTENLSHRRRRHSKRDFSVLEFIGTKQVNSLSDFLQNSYSKVGGFSGKNRRRYRDVPLLITDYCFPGATVCQIQVFF